MKALFACEESQACTIEYRAKGVEAYSADIQECSGGRPEWHIQGDV
ncbi:MAG: DNA cytosine methyltransferase, partial [Gammaproteobacteria bacterium]